MLSKNIYKEFVHCDNWETYEAIDNITWVIMHLPPRMRLVADLKIAGYENEAISRMMDITKKEVVRKIRIIKKRILRGESIL